MYYNLRMTNCLSVIIPTVQKTLNILEELLSILERDSCVDEILLINNKPEVPLNFSSDKIRIITPEQNLYVNPSWNLGIDEIRNNNFVLMNDDMLIGENFCGKIVNSEVFNSENTGLIGMAGSMIKSFDALCKFSNANPEFTILKNHLGTRDWGISIFGRKENYYKIPDDLKIIFGDNYLLYKNKLDKKINYAVSNLPCRHMHSVSSASDEFSQIVGEDISNSSKYFEKQEVKSITKKISSEKFEDFEVVLNGDVSVIKLLSSRNIIYFKYKNGTEKYSKIFLKDVLNQIMHDVINKELLIEKIIDTLLNSEE